VITNILASNFERLICDLLGPGRTAELYSSFDATGSFTFNKQEFEIFRNQNLIGIETNAATAEESIRLIEDSVDYRMCPHTAVGYGAISGSGRDRKHIVAATAHPDKFEKSNRRITAPIENVSLSKLTNLTIPVDDPFPANYETIEKFITDFAWEKAFRGANSGSVL